MKAKECRGACNERSIIIYALNEILTIKVIVDIVTAVRKILAGGKQKLHLLRHLDRIFLLILITNF